MIKLRLAEAKRPWHDSRLQEEAPPLACFRHAPGAAAQLLADGAALKAEADGQSLRITLPEKLSDAAATVVRVKLAGAPVVATPGPAVPPAR